MKVQTIQRDKIIDVLEQLAEDAGYESYESGGEENEIEKWVKNRG